MAGDQSNENGRTPVRWKDIERFALILGVVVPAIYYFTAIEGKINRMDMKLTTVIAETAKDKKMLVNLHATIGPPLPCAQCMASSTTAPRR